MQSTTAITSGDLRQGLFVDFIHFISRGRGTDSRTAQTYLVNLRQFVAWMRYMGIRRPEQKDIIDYLGFLSSEHPAIQLDSRSPSGWSFRTDHRGFRISVSCKPATVNQYLNSIRQFFKWTAVNSLYPNIADGIPGLKVQRDTHKKDALSPTDVLKIENSIREAAADRTTRAAEAEKDTAGRILRATEQGKRNMALFLLAVTMGLRTVELSRANIGDLEVRDGEPWMFIWGKGRHEPDTKKPMAKEVYSAVVDYLQSRGDNPTQSSPLFVSTGNRSRGQRMATTTISTILKGEMQKAGYDSPRITAHSLRHTTGTAVIELTGNIYDTQHFMRHADPRTTEIYTHTDQSRNEAEIARRLYAHYHGHEEDDREKLAEILNTLSPEQIRSLTAVASAMRR